MEDVMPARIQVWFDRPPRPRPEDSYVRKSPKIVKCRNAQAHAPSYAAKTAAIFAHSHTRQSQFTEWIGKIETEDAAAQQLADANAEPASTKAKFRQLANEWSKEVSNVSSVEALTSHPKYQEIIRLGWDAVPYLLADLQQNRGFWFTALNQITGIRPFDPGEAGKSKRMAEAWIRWGKRKGII